ncbi:Bacterial regulatory protein [compost metagenome]
MTATLIRSLVSVARRTASEPMEVSETTTSRKERISRGLILEVAARLIVEQGFGACTMRSISDRLEIKAASLYHHFPSKDDIVVEIMNLGASMLLDEVARAVAALPEGTSFRDTLRTAIHAHTVCKVDTSAPFMQVYEHLPPVMKRESRQARRLYSEFWIALIERGKTAGQLRENLDTTIFVSYLLGGLNRVPEWFHSESMDVAQVVDVIMASTWEGIALDD